MNMIRENDIQAFETYLYLNEKSRATTVKYIRAVRRLTEFLQDEELTKRRLLEYRELLMGQMKAQTVNGVLSVIREAR